MQTFDFDGVPVFRAEQSGGDEHEPTIGVYFRVGSHDEDFSTAGLTALSVRMILASLPVDVRDSIDVWGSGVFSHFSINGDAGGTALRALGEAIANIKWDRLEQQKLLLQTNDGIDGLVGEAHLFHARYGAIGPGTAWMRKVAFSAATQEMVQRWLDRYFNKANAAIAVVGDVPIGASFPLPAGVAHDFLLLESMVSRLPARLVLGDDENAVGFQLTAPLTASTHVAFAVLSDTLHRRLVSLESLTPEIAIESQMIDSNVASFTAVFPVHPANAVAAVDAVLQTLEDFGNGLIGADLFERRQAELVEASAYPDSHWAVDQTAQRRLFPAVQTLDARHTEATALTLESVGEVVKRAMADTLLIATAPNGVGSAAQFPLHQPVVVPEVTGKVSRLRGVMRLLGRKVHIAYNSEGLSLHDNEGTTTIRFKDAVAVTDSGVSISIVDRTGTILTIYREVWTKSDELGDTIRNNVEADRVIQMKPVAEELDAARAISQGVRAFSGWRLLLPIVVFIFLVINAGLLIFGSDSERAQAAGQLITFAAVLALSVWWQRRSSQKRESAHRHPH